MTIQEGVSQEETLIELANKQAKEKLTVSQICFNDVPGARAYYILTKELTHNYDQKNYDETYNIVIRIICDLCKQ